MGEFWAGIVAALAAIATAQSHPSEPLITSADYPFHARKAGLHGKTVIFLRLTGEGRVAGCSLYRSSGSLLLDAHACSRIRSRGRFAPAKDGKQRYVRGTVRWEFERSGADPINPTHVFDEWHTMNPDWRVGAPFDLDAARRTGRVKDCKMREVPARCRIAAMPKDSWFGENMLAGPGELLIDDQRRLVAVRIDFKRADKGIGGFSLSGRLGPACWSEGQKNAKRYGWINGRAFALLDETRFTLFDPGFDPTLVEAMMKTCPIVGD